MSPHPSSEVSVRPGRLLEPRSAPDVPCNPPCRSVSPSCCLKTPGTSSDLSEPRPTVAMPGAHQMTPQLELDVHFSFQTIPNTRPKCGQGDRVRLGTWTLHTQGALGGGGQLNNWSESQKRGELVSGVSSRVGQGLWGAGPDAGPDQRSQTRAPTAALPGAHSWGRAGRVLAEPCAGVSAGCWADWKSLRPELRNGGAKPLGVPEPVSSCVRGTFIILALPPAWGCCEEPASLGTGRLWPPQGMGHQGPSLWLCPRGPAQSRHSCATPGKRRHLDGKRTCWCPCAVQTGPRLQRDRRVHLWAGACLWPPSECLGLSLRAQGGCLCGDKLLRALTELAGRPTGPAQGAAGAGGVRAQTYSRAAAEGPGR